MSPLLQRLLVIQAVAAVVVLAAGTARAVDDDLASLLEQVGPEYAAAYAEPAIDAFGALQNSALYHTARVPVGGLTFGVALKAMGTHRRERDQTFRRAFDVENLSEVHPGFPAVAGRAVLEGPTVIGDTGRRGTITAYVDGEAVAQLPGVPGLADTRWIPLFVPELTLGGIGGFQGTLRWLPGIKLGDFGKTDYLGWGLQFSPNHYLPSLALDVAVGYFKQQVEVGDVTETDAHSVFVAASKELGAVTVYGGWATERGETRVSYDWENTGEHVEFTGESKMDTRVTLGTSVDVGAALYAEVGLAEMTVFSLGVVFGR